MVNRQRKWMALTAMGALALSAPTMTGCSSTPTTAQQYVDPLHGHFTPPGNAVPPNSATKATNTPIAPPTQTGGIPPIPTFNTATNPATLAGGSGFQVSLARPLAIDDEGRTQTPGQFTARSQPTGFVPANPNPKVEQVPDAAPSAPPASWQLSAGTAPPTLPALSNPSADPADVIRQQLQARGVVNQKVDPVANGIHLTCYVPRTDSQGLRVLEVTATDYTAAAQAILRQLEPRAP